MNRLTKDLVPERHVELLRMPPPHLIRVPRACGGQKVMDDRASLI